MCGPHHCLGRDAFASGPEILRRLLQLRQNASILEQGCAGFSPGSANRCHQFTRHPGRTSSPLRPRLSCRYTQGLAVTSNHKICRRPCPMISNPQSRRNEIVGTTNISIAAVPSAWLRRNVLQPWDGGSRRLTMYLATLLCPISTPSLRRSPWPRDAPHSGLAMLISRISLRISNGTVGLPPRAFDFQREYNRKPALCHLTTVSGFTIASASRTPGRSR